MRADMPTMTRRSGDFMFNNITIRGGLTLILSVFVGFLLTVIGVGYGALKLTN